MPSAPSEAAEAFPPTRVVSETAQELADRAVSQYNQAQQYLRSGDWAKYGEEIEKLRETLQLLQSAISR